MTSTVENTVTNQKMITDASGKLWVGMTREDALKGKSLFMNLPEDFDRVDTDGDNKLSPGEMYTEIENNYRKQNERINNSILVGSFFTGMSIMNKNKRSRNFSLGMAVGSVCIGLWNEVAKSKSAQKMAALNNQI